MTSQTSQFVPKLQTELNVTDIPMIYRRFDEVVGARAWTHRVRQMKDAIKGNPFLVDHLRAENDIAFALDHCGMLISKYGHLPEASDTLNQLYPGISLAAQTLSLMNIADRIEAERLRNRVQGAFANPDDMRAYRLELTAATHFSRRGWEVAWPEMMRSGETFDLLTTSPAGKELEVECKSVSDNKGRNIHRREALDFQQLVAKELAPMRKTLEAGLAVVLTTPAKLPTKTADRQALAKHIRKQIHIGSGAQLDDGSEIRIKEFDPTIAAHFATTGNAGKLRPVIEAVTGTKNREGMLIGTSKGGAIAFVVQSAINDNMMDATFKRLGEAAKDQLTGRRPGLLIAGFDGIDSEQLISIAEQDHDQQQQPTALAIGVSKFLSSASRTHVVGVGFVSGSSLLPVAPGIVDSGGAAYYFPCKESPLWDDEFSGLFQGSSESVTRRPGIRVSA